MARLEVLTSPHGNQFTQVPLTVAQLLGNVSTRYLLGTCQWTYQIYSLQLPPTLTQSFDCFANR